MSKTHTLSVIIIILSSWQHNDTLRWTDDKTMFFDRIMMISSEKLLVCPCKCHTCVFLTRHLLSFLVLLNLIFENISLNRRILRKISQSKFFSYHAWNKPTRNQLQNNMEWRRNFILKNNAKDLACEVKWLVVSRFFFCHLNRHFYHKCHVIYLICSNECDDDYVQSYWMRHAWWRMCGSDFF